MIFTRRRRIQSYRENSWVSQWPRPSDTPRDRDVHFQIPHHYEDQLQKCGPSEWQDLLDGLQHPDVTLFVVGNYFQEEWHTLHYLASSPSLIRTRYVTSPSP